MLHEATLLEQVLIFTTPVPHTRVLVSAPDGRLAKDVVQHHGPFDELDTGVHAP
jgi:hypothetical protein